MYIIEAPNFIYDIALEWAKKVDWENSKKPWNAILAIRFDNKVYRIGDVLPSSKDNSGRFDPREFPSYGSNEYDSLEWLIGTSAYEILDENNKEDKYDKNYLKKILGTTSQSKHAFKHCNIVAGPRTNEDPEDRGEVILDPCKVMAKIY